MSLRLFAALALPDDIAEPVTALQRGVLGAAWRPRDRFHITLRYFGEVDERLAHDLDAALDRIGVGPLELSLTGAGWFGKAAPTALWLGVDGGPELKRLADGCERAARRVGLAPDKRAFAPHLTLAYCAGTQADDAVRFVQRVGALRSPVFTVDRFALYSSWRGKGPSHYVEEAVYPLRGPSSGASSGPSSGGVTSDPDADMI